MSDSPVHEDAKGSNLALATAVEDVLTRRKWSLRAAELYTGVHYNTIDRLKKGQSVDIDQIIKFARAIAEKDKEVETALYFLKLSGKDDVASLVEAATRLAASVPMEDTQEVELSSGQRVRIIAIGDKPGIDFNPTPENVAELEGRLVSLQKPQNSPD